jgi:4-amino-4-deoxy-L-arabinose transferase-like glycosyltransferase
VAAEILMSRRTFIAGVLAILVAAGLLRTLWLRADPPTTSVGIVWHDEGAWVHNARNLALWGESRTDNWNPVYIAPVFTALEYGSFAVFGVGTWQARLVPVVSGLAAVALLIAGLNALAGRRAALLGGTLLATNYMFVMWNRAALMESTMTAFLVAGWAAYAMSDRRPAWGLAAGICAALAFFTKAAAAFFVAALVFDAIVTLMRSPHRRGALMALAGLGGAGLVAAAVFVLPEWSEYYRYNWLTAVERKPSYALRDLIDRASWLPVAQDAFARMWLVFVAGLFGLSIIVARWRIAKPAERLLVLWVLVGLLELTVHDSGNARRYVMFIPAIIALAALVVAAERPRMPFDLAASLVRRRWVALPLILFLAYLAFGSLLRMVFQDDADAGRFALTVRLATACAVAFAALLLWQWSATVRWLAGRRGPVWVMPAILLVAVGWNGALYARWAAARTHFNYQASVEVGRRLEPGTLVHGKLANGLSLENRIRPVFVGNGFGNYEDRLRRDDVGYILTYVLPAVGYESQEGSGLIQDILDQYPSRRVVASFDVEETPGTDRAELIQKTPIRIGRARD